MSSGRLAAIRDTFPSRFPLKLVSASKIMDFGNHTEGRSPELRRETCLSEKIGAGSADRQSKPSNWKRLRILGLLPRRSPRENSALVELAEGEELGSSLPHAVQSSGAYCWILRPPRPASRDTCSRSRRTIAHRFGGDSGKNCLDAVQLEAFPFRLNRNGGSRF
jgi:hypothetical protein